MEQLVGEPARQALNPLALFAVEGRQPTLMARQLVATYLLDTRANLLDRGNEVESLEPAHEGVGLELDYLLGLLRFALALLERFFRHRPEIIDVVQIKIGDQIDPLVEVAGHAKVDQEHRAVMALAHDRLAFRGVEHRSADRERSDHYVSKLQIRLVAIERHRGAVERAGQRDRMLETATGYQHRLHPRPPQMARGKFRHLPRPQKHHRLVFE